MDDSQSQAPPLHRSMAVDRLSGLPEPLIHEILSFLPIREGAATTLLAKRWKDVWTTVPYLHFQFDKEKHDSYNFPDYVNRALANWKGTKILQFSIDMQEMGEVYDHDDIHSWVRFAVEKQVEELYLKLSWNMYHLPVEVYSCTSIKKLSLVYVEVHPEEKVSWNELSSFTLAGSMNCSDYVINQILEGAPCLEVLDLRTELICGDLDIRSTSLKTLKIYYGDILPSYDDDAQAPTVATISAPILESLEFAGIRYTSRLLKVLSLTNANLDSDLKLEVVRSWISEVGEMLNEAVMGFSHAVRLKLNKWSLTLLVDELNEHIIVQFSNATFLKLCAVDAEGMLNVLEMFPELEMLIIERKENGEYNPMVCDHLAFHQPSLLHLKEVEITWCEIQNDDSIIPVIKTLLKDAPVLEKMVVRLGMHGAGAELDLNDLRHVDIFL